MKLELPQLLELLRLIITALLSGIGSRAERTQLQGALAALSEAKDVHSATTRSEVVQDPQQRLPLRPDPLTGHWDFRADQDPPQS